MNTERGVIPYHIVLGHVHSFLFRFDMTTDPNMWIGLVREEEAELVQAMKHESVAAQVKEFCDLQYVGAGLTLALDENPDFLSDSQVRSTVSSIVTRCDQTCRDFYVENVLGGEVSRSILIEAFLRVHDSNMSKLDDDGKPIRRHDGKILKGPNYHRPDIQSLFTQLQEEY